MGNKCDSILSFDPTLNDGPTLYLRQRIGVPGLRLWAMDCIESHEGRQIVIAAGVLISFNSQLRVISYSQAVIAMPLSSEMPVTTLQRVTG